MGCYSKLKILTVMGIAAVLELGCLFGALGAGVLADRVSRRSSIASACGACGSYDGDLL